MRAGIVITMSVLVPSIYMATFDVYPEKKTRWKYVQIKQHYKGEDKGGLDMRN